MSGSSTSRRSRTDPMRVAACCCCQGASSGGSTGMWDLLMPELHPIERKVYRSEFACEDWLGHGGCVDDGHVSAIDTNPSD
jgi:hypothetical protein